MNSNYNKLILKLGINRVEKDKSLSALSSFHIGGKADLFFRTQSVQDLVSAVVEARKHNIPFFIIGGGTNLLISDKGFRGIVIKNDSGGIKMVGIKGGTDQKAGISKGVHTVYLEVEGGVTVNRIVRFTLDQGLSGLEYFLGQPGTIGGGIWINAHNMKYNKFIGDTISKVKILTPENTVLQVEQNYFKFGYDSSIIQKTNDIVLSAIFMLKKADSKELWSKASEVLQYRNKTQPRGAFTSGCTFRNISKPDALRLATPEFTCSAGYLLDSVGLKGRSIGDAQFSENHANFIINKGRANAASVLELINLAKKKILKKYNIVLKEEIVLVGDF